MKKNILILLCLFCAQAKAQDHAGEVKKVVNRLCVAMAKGDSAALRLLFDSSARLQTCYFDKKAGHNVLAEEPLEEFLAQVAQVQRDSLRIEERLLSYDVKVDDPLATVWTPYRFYYNGKLSHTGCNAFQLFHSQSGWKIIQVTDTRKRNTILKK